MTMMHRIARLTGIFVVLLLAGCIMSVDESLPYDRLPEITVATPFNLVASPSHPTAYLSSDKILAGEKVRIIGTDKNAAWLLVLHDNLLGWMPTFFSATNIATLTPAVVVEPLSDKCTKYFGATFQPTEAWVSTINGSALVLGTIYRPQAEKQFDSASLAVEIGGPGAATAADYIHLSLTGSSAVIFFAFSVDELQSGSQIRFRLTSPSNEPLFFETAFFSDDCPDDLDTARSELVDWLPIGQPKATVTKRVAAPEGAAPTPTQRASIVTPTPVVIARESGSTTSVLQRWTFCADENQFCAFSGTKEVRYGANGQYVVKKITNGTNCSNGVFGDPITGVVKECYYRGVQTQGSLSGPIAYWRMEESTGTTVADYSGHGHVLNLAAVPSRPQWSIDVPATHLSNNSSLLFDGVDDFADAGVVSEFDFTIGFTAEAWVKMLPNQPSPDSGIVGKLNLCCTYEGWMLWFRENVVVGYVNGSYRAVGTTQIRDNRWHHVAMTWDGAMVRVYVDGYLDGSGPYSIAPNSASQPLRVGGYRYGYRNFAGHIDEVKLYDYERTGEQIREDAGLVPVSTCVHPPDGLVSWWPGDGNADDIVGVNNGKLIGGVEFTDGMVGQAFRFDGSNDIVMATATGFPTRAAPRTVAFWAKTDPSANDATGFGYGNETAGGGFYIFPAHGENSRRLTFSGHGTSVNVFASNDLRDGQYHYVVAIYDGSKLTLYVDGASVAAGNPGLNTGTSGGACIGGRCYQGEFFAGEIDEIAVWDRSLSRAEIEALFNAGSAGMCKPGTGTKPTPTPASHNTYSIQSYNYPDRYVRHQNSLGELTQITSDLDRHDATFVIVPGLANNNCISFESLNYPQSYLRHQDFRIKLHTFEDTELFKADATFCKRLSLADPALVSFESYNYPGYFLRHRDFHLYIEPDNDALFRADVTFSLIAPFVASSSGGR